VSEDYGAARNAIVREVEKFVKQLAAEFKK